jgi:ABC-type multidrug transport system ATPase subunit
MLSITISAKPGHDLERFFEEVGLSDDVARRPLRTYSKGMRQKVGIAIALAKRADVLVLDEPTAGLDPGGERIRESSRASARGALRC